MGRHKTSMNEANRTYYSGEYGRLLALYKQLAAAGNAEAAERVGFMLLQGDSLFGPQVRCDVDRTMEFLEQAAGAGRPAAGFLLNMVLTSE